MLLGSEISSSSMRSGRGICTEACVMVVPSMANRANSDMLYGYWPVHCHLSLACDETLMRLFQPVYIVGSLWVQTSVPASFCLCSVFSTRSVIFGVKAEVASAKAMDTGAATVSVFHALFDFSWLDPA